MGTPAWFRAAERCLSKISGHAAALQNCRPGETRISCAISIGKSTPNQLRPESCLPAPAVSYPCTHKQCGSPAWLSNHPRLILRATKSPPKRAFCGSFTLLGYQKRKAPRRPMVLSPSLSVNRASTLIMEVTKYLPRTPMVASVAELSSSMYIRPTLP